MNNESFKNLNNIFNIDTDDEKMCDELDFETNDNDNINETKSTFNKKRQKYTLSDLEYIKTELQDRIEKNRIVADELAQTLKVGAPPRLYEVYAKLSTTISEDIMHLAQVEKTITDYQVTESREELHKQQMEQRQMAVLKKIENSKTGGQTLVQNNIQNTYNMTSSELLAKTMEAISNEETNEITSMEDLPKFNLD